MRETLPLPPTTGRVKNKEGSDLTVARHRRATPAKPVRIPVVAITDAHPRSAHLVTDEAFTAGCRAGRYLAACGAEVLTASLTTPERSHCKSCARWRAAQ